MKNKFNIGDKIVLIQQLNNRTWESSNEIIKEVLYSGEGGTTYLIHSSIPCVIHEENLYTKEEAIKFLEGVLV